MESENLVGVTPSKKEKILIHILESDDSFRAILGDNELY
jgi:hypothetical protein